MDCKHLTVTLTGWSQHNHCYWRHTVVEGQHSIPTQSEFSYVSGAADKLCRVVVIVLCPECLICDGNGHTCVCQLISIVCIIFITTTYHNAGSKLQSYAQMSRSAHKVPCGHRVNAEPGDGKGRQTVVLNMCIPFLEQNTNSPGLKKGKQDLIYAGLEHVHPAESQCTPADRLP